MENKLTIRPEFCFVLAMLLLLVPIRWVFAWLFAAVFHELCHIIILRICKCRITRVQIGLRGAIMETDTLSWGREMICALAGPAGGLLLLLFARWLPRTAICSLLLSVYNLLPLYPLDGGRALRGFIFWLLPGEFAEKITGIIEPAVFLLITGVSVYAWLFLDLGMLPMLLIASLFYTRLKLKCPCKPRRKQVQ